MAQYAFKYAPQTEFLCEADSVIEAKLKADVFIDREVGITEPYGWVPTAEKDVFRISVGA